MCKKCFSKNLPVCCCRDTNKFNNDLLNYLLEQIQQFTGNNTFYGNGDPNFLFPPVDVDLYEFYIDFDTSNVYQFNETTEVWDLIGNLSVNFTFQNGLNESSGTVELGGTLLHDTTVDSNGSLLQLGSNDENINLGDGNSIVITDNTSLTGALYDADYSANFVPLSLITKGFTDATYITLTQKGQPNGVATLDGGGKVPIAQLPNSIMEFKGNWNANTNTPFLIDGVGDTGDVYRTIVAGDQNLGSGLQHFEVGDWIMYNGTIWQRSPAAYTPVAGLSTWIQFNTSNAFDADADFTFNKATNILTVGTSVNSNIGEIRLGGTIASGIIRANNDLVIDGNTLSFRIGNTPIVTGQLLSNSGFSYNADYSSFNISNPRWLIDKGYGDTNYAPISGSNNYIQNQDLIIQTPANFKISGTGEAKSYETFGTFTAVGGLGRANIFSNTLVATANGDLLIGLDLTPSYTLDGFTNTINSPLRATWNTSQFIISDRTGAGNVTFHASTPTSSNFFMNASGANVTLNAPLNAGVISFGLGNIAYGRFAGTTGNLILQNGGVFTDNTNRLQVNGNIYGSAMIGLQTSAPTHAMTLSSTASADGFVMYNTASQVTNFERIRMRWVGNTLDFLLEAGGTGIMRSIRIGGGSDGFTFASAGVMHGFNQTSAALNSINTRLRGVKSAAAGIQNEFAVMQTLNQSGAAGYRAIWVTPFEQALGSGVKYLMDIGTNSAVEGSGVHTSKFTVNSIGDVMAIGTVINFANLPTNATTDFSVTVDSTGNLRKSASTIASKQVHTAGATVTISDTVRSLYVNPAALLATLTITLPAAPMDGQEVLVHFGGTILSGTVVTTLSIVGNIGHTFFITTPITTAVAGDGYMFRFESSTNLWRVF